MLALAPDKWSIFWQMQAVQRPVSNNYKSFTPKSPCKMISLIVVVVAVLILDDLRPIRETFIYLSGKAGNKQVA